MCRRFGGPSNFSVISHQFVPVPELTRSDVDMQIIFLSARGLVYPAPVDDPWFSAHHPGPEITIIFNQDSSSTRQTYETDEPANPLACIQQIQVCNPNAHQGSQCQELGGLQTNLINTPLLWEDVGSRERMEWIRKIIAAHISAPDDILNFGGGSILLARLVQSAAQGRLLPPNHWQEEVIHWTGSMMASVQALFVETAMGVTKKEFVNGSTFPETNEARRVCQNQVSNDCFTF